MSLIQKNQLIRGVTHTSIDTSSKNSDSNSTCSESKNVSLKNNSASSQKEYTTKKFRSVDDKYPGLNKSRKKRINSREFHDRNNFCERIIEVQEEGEEKEGPKKKRWIHPIMLFDGEDNLQGKNYAINLAVRTDGRSRSSELLRLPKIIENNIEDDTSVICQYNKVKSLNHNKFLLRIDKLEDNFNSLKMKSCNNTFRPTYHNTSTLAIEEEELENENGNEDRISIFSNGQKSSRKDESLRNSALSSPRSYAVKKVLVDEFDLEEDNSKNKYKYYSKDEAPNVTFFPS